MSEQVKFSTIGNGITEPINLIENITKVLDSRGENTNAEK